MRKNWKKLERFRVRDRPPHNSETGDTFGAFEIPSPGPNARVVAGICKPVVIAANPEMLHVIAIDGLETGWDHVSVSVVTRCPTWPEMVHVKNLFWYASETVLQFHPGADEYIDNHPFVLHLWKPTQFDIALPLGALV